MNGTEFVLSVGVKKALEILGEEVWDKAKLTFEQWESQYRQDSQHHRQSDEALKAKILTKMADTASTRDHWLQIWQMMPTNSPLRLLAMEKIRGLLQALIVFDQVMGWRPLVLQLDFQGAFRELNAAWLERLEKLAGNFQTWSTVRHEARLLGNSDLAAKALNEMVNYAEASDTAEDWRSIIKATSCDSPAYEEALSNLSRLAQTHDEKFSVWYLVKNHDNDLARLTWQEVIGSASTFQEWFSILAHTKEEETAVRELCANKLLERAETFPEWLDIYQSTNNDLIKIKALNQLLAKAEDNLNQWITVFNSTPEGSAAKAQALKRIRGFVKFE